MRAALKLTEKEQFLEMFEDANKIFLRRIFDNSMTPATAKAAIEVTREKGYTELADEMENDLIS